MSAQIDVLAVLDEASYVLSKYGVHAGFQLNQARDAVAELIEERDRLRKELAWNLPVVWALRTDDPDPQYDFAVGKECPAGWEGKAAPLYDGQGMRPINWQKAVAELVSASCTTSGRILRWRTEGHAPSYREWIEIEDILDAALARVTGERA